MEGSVTCLTFTDGCAVMDEPELFVGYENGAIGMFRFQLEPTKADGTLGNLSNIKLFTA